MATSTDVLVRLADDLSWFIITPEIRLLHVATGSTERDVVLRQLALAEGHGHNQSPFFVLEDATTGDDDGWLPRAERTAAIHDARRKLLAAEGMTLQPIQPVVHGGALPIGAFAWQLHQCLAAQASTPPLRGIVVVLAPAQLTRPDAFAADVLGLLRLPELANARFIVLELGDATAGPFAAALGETMLRNDASVDTELLRKEQAAALAAAAAAPPGASPEVAAGFAGPKDVIAPPRHGKPPRDQPLSPEQEAFLKQELGPAVALLGASGALLRKRVTGAALAMQEKRFGDALQLQWEACTQLFAAGLTRLGCILEITLAAYYLHAGDANHARSTFESASKRAKENDFGDVAAQALLGLAAVLAVANELEAAVQTYARAGDLAAESGNAILGVEAYRTAGQIALHGGAEQAAVIAWRRALTLAQASPPEQLAPSSAADVARSLAAVLLKLGAQASAQSLLAQADTYDAAKA